VIAAAMLDLPQSGKPITVADRAEPFGSAP
jgi:hypothetical protein